MLIPALPSDILELSLLLYWRHVAFFVDPERVDRETASNAISARPDFGLGLAESLRSRTSQTVSLPSLRKAIAEEFSQVIAPKLSSLEFVSARFVRREG